MGSTKTSQFPTSLWPGVPIPEVEVDEFEPVLLRDGYVRWRERTVPHVLRPLPLELALRELRGLDVADSEAVVQFCSDYGAITRRWPGLEHVKGIPRSSSNHVADLALHLAMAQLLVNHWVTAVDGDDVVEIWQSEVAASLHCWSVDEAFAWSNWCANLNEGLAAIRVRAEYPIPGFEHAVVGQPMAGLYTGLCVQIYNLAAEGLVPLVCQDETCRVRFVRQRGGAKAGQYRLHGDRMYCSPGCARRQGQRKRRATMRNMRR